MISKEQLLESVIAECMICQSLFSKLPASCLDYRPTAGQRSGLELLRYMSFAFAGAAHAIVEGNWDWYSKAEQEAAQLEGPGFPAAMDRQIAELKELFTSISEQTFSTQQVCGLPWPDQKTVGVELFNNCFRWIVGYKMQLFLYGKACGAENLGTGDCWFATEAGTPEIK